MININELLTKMRQQVEYSNVVTMPIPLYQEIKLYISEVEKREEKALRKHKKTREFLQEVHSKYADLNLSFADNWYANVEDLFADSPESPLQEGDK